MGKYQEVLVLDDFEVQEDEPLELSVAKRLMGVYQKNPRVNVFLNGLLMEEGSDYEVVGNKLGFLFVLNSGSVVVVQTFKKDGSITKQTLRI